MKKPLFLFCLMILLGGLVWSFDKPISKNILQNDPAKKFCDLCCCPAKNMSTDCDEKCFKMRAVSKNKKAREAYYLLQEMCQDLCVFKANNYRIEHHH